MSHNTIHNDFLETYISQGSVATLLMCGGMFIGDFIANLLMKEFWKLVSLQCFDTVGWASGRASSP